METTLVALLILSTLLEADAEILTSIWRENPLCIVGFDSLFSNYWYYDRSLLVGMCGKLIVLFVCLRLLLLSFSRNFSTDLSLVFGWPAFTYALVYISRWSFMVKGSIVWPCFFLRSTGEYEGPTTFGGDLLSFSTFSNNFLFLLFIFGLTLCLVANCRLYFEG